MGNFLRQGIRYINKKMNLKEKKYLLLDLDGVCYGKHNNYSLERVFGQVSKRMTQFISEKLKIDKDKAKELQTNYFYKYNTSLRGLMVHNGISPDEFLSYVHEIDLSFMKEDKIMRNVPKPEAETFDLMVKKFGINPKETIYIEDIAKNLSIGHERGCTTVWLINDEHFGKMDADKDFISHKIENLSLFLKEIRLLKSN